MENFDWECFIAYTFVLLVMLCTAVLMLSVTIMAGAAAIDAISSL